MILTQELADKILDNLIRVLDFELEVTDRRGRVMAATQPARVGCFDESYFLAAGQHAEAGASYVQCSGIGRVRVPVVWNRQCLGEVYLTGSPEQSASYVTLIETILHLVLEGELGGEAETDSPTEGVLKALIAPHQPGKMADKEKVLDGCADWVVVVFELFQKEDDQPLALEQVAQVLYDFRSASSRLFVEMLGERQLVLLQQVEVSKGGWNRQRTQERLKTYCRNLDGYPWLGYYASCGNYYPGIERLSISYQSALDTLAVGKRVRPKQKLYVYEDLALEVLLSSVSGNWTTEYLAAQYRNLADQDKNGCLQKTLETLFKTNLNQGEAARRLHIHRNTLRYRMDKIKACTGMDLNDLGSVFSLYSAYKISFMGLV